MNETCRKSYGINPTVTLIALLLDSNNTYAKDFSSASQVFNLLYNFIFDYVMIPTVIQFNKPIITTYCAHTYQMLISCV